MGKKLEKETTLTHLTQLDETHLVILATPKAVKVTGITSWIHHSQIKKAAAPTEPNDWQTIHDPTNPLKLRLQRTSQQHTIAQENSSPAPATFRKLVGQRMAESLRICLPGLNAFPFLPPLPHLTD
jgi:hypothetical protein